VNYWNGKAFRRYMHKSFFNNKGTNYRLTTKRLGAIVTSLGIYLPAEVLIWLGLLLDEIFFRDFHQIKIREPVFIIGNPRSGTTFLQRLLARDTKNFITMRTWEIFGAPSIFMRKALRMILKIGLAFRVPISRRIREMESLWQESDAIHRLKLRLPEEDDLLLIHIFSTIRIWSYAAMVEEANPYIYYDDLVTPEDKERIMDFYEGCIQRHFFYHRGLKRHYLSKNPNFSPAIDTLLGKFPDAKFIYLLRNPMDAVPSHLSLKEREWQMLGSPLEKYACREFILETADHWYNYPLRRLKDLPEDQAIIVEFDDLVANAKKTVGDIYNRFGFDISENFQSILEQATVKARNHESKHVYSLIDMGLTEEYLKERFAEVYSEYDFK
jgi:hypothetical protein